MKEYTLEEARAFANNLTEVDFRRPMRLDDVNTIKLSKTLRTLAENKEKELFEKTVDRYSWLCTLDGGKMRYNTYGFLEWLCVCADRGFFKTMYKQLIGNPLPVTKTREFFQELYGAHFR